MASGRAAIASSGVISGSGLAMAKTIGSLAMVFSIAGVNAPFAERPRKYRRLRAPAPAARARLDRVRALPLIHALDAATIDHALGVAERDIRRTKAERLGEIETGDAGGAGAVADEFRGFDVAPGQL